MSLLPQAKALLQLVTVFSRSRFLFRPRWKIGIISLPSRVPGWYDHSGRGYRRARGHPPKEQWQIRYQINRSPLFISLSSWKSIFSWFRTLIVRRRATFLYPFILPEQEQREEQAFSRVTISDCDSNPARLYNPELTHDDTLPCSDDPLLSFSRVVIPLSIKINFNRVSIYKTSVYPIWNRSGDENHLNLQVSSEVSGQMEAADAEI